MSKLTFFFALLLVCSVIGSDYTSFCQMKTYPSSCETDCENTGYYQGVRCTTSDPAAAMATFIFMVTFIGVFMLFLIPCIPCLLVEMICSMIPIVNCIWYCISVILSPCIAIIVAPYFLCAVITSGVVAIVFAAVVGIATA